MCECLFVKFGRVFLVVLNIIFLLLGLAIIIPAAIILTSSDVLTGFTDSLLERISLGGVPLDAAFATLPYAMMGVGAIIFVISLIGLLGACCKFKVLLVVYAIIVFFIAAIELAIVIVFLILGGAVEKTLKDSMSTELTSGYKSDDVTSDEISTAWNYLFVQLDCCGVEDVTSSSNGFDQATGWTNKGTQKIPKSCCKGLTLDNIVDNYPTYANSDCTNNLVTAQYRTKGCYNKLKDNIMQYAMLFGIIGCIVFAFQVLLGIFAICLCLKGKKD